MEQKASFYAEWLKHKQLKYELYLVVWQNFKKVKTTCQFYNTKLHKKWCSSIRHNVQKMYSVKMCQFAKVSRNLVVTKEQSEKNFQKWVET